MKKKTQRKIISIIFLLMLLISLLASLLRVRADELVTATLIGIQEEITVGDVIPLTLEVTHPAGYRLLPVQVDGAWGEFEVRSTTTVEVTANEDGTQTSRQTLAVTLWHPGNFTTPDLDVSVTDTAGQVLQVPVTAVSLAVSSVLIEGDTELRDIKPQAALPLSIWPWVLAGVVVLALAALIARTLIRRWQAEPARPPVPAPVAPQPAYQVALAELARIERLNLPAQGQYKQHYSLIADALRRYLKEAFNVPALDRTTGEIRQAIRPLLVAPEQKTALINLLGEADLVKFAKLRPDSDTAQQAIGEARQFVLATQPEPALIGPGQAPQEYMEPVV